HCLLSESPPDSPQEIAAMARNQHKTAAYGREPGLQLERGDQQVTLAAWGAELVSSFEPIAASLDATHGTTDYRDALRSAQALLAEPQLLPSARVLAAMERDHENSFTGFVRAQSQQTKDKLLGLPYSAALHKKLDAMAQKSLQDQRDIEAGDTMPFEIYRQQYVSAERLGVAAPAPIAALAAA
ncbi:MAG: glutamate--cysteine ligase, partial [Ramlibacter sp.]